MYKQHPAIIFTAAALQLAEAQGFGVTSKGSKDAVVVATALADTNGGLCVYPTWWVVTICYIENGKILRL